MRHAAYAPIIAVAVHVDATVAVQAAATGRVRRRSLGCCGAVARASCRPRIPEFHIQNRTGLGAVREQANVFQLLVETALRQQPPCPSKA